MNVQEAVRNANDLLPGRAAPEGSEDPRWQAIIAVGNFIKTDPHAVWGFVEQWGVHPDDDLRTAIATCLLEHLLECHFDTFFPRVQDLVRANRLFADTFSRCWKYGQSEEPINAERFDALKREAPRLRL